VPHRQGKDSIGASCIGDATRVRLLYWTLAFDKRCRTLHSNERLIPMPNIALVLKQEITRLARREARTLTKPLQRAVAQFRREIAELKRRTVKAQLELKRIKRLGSDAAAPKQGDEGTTRARFSVASVKSQRRRLNLSAAEFGKLIGVTGHTVYMWEHGVSRPRASQRAAFAAVRPLGKKAARARLEQLAAAESSGGKSKRKRG